MHVTAAMIENMSNFMIRRKTTKSKCASSDICSYGYFLAIARIAYPWSHTTTMSGSFTFSKYNDANGPLRRAIRLPAAVPFYASTIDRASACNLHSRVAIRLWKMMSNVQHVSSANDEDWSGICNIKIVLYVRCYDNNTWGIFISFPWFPARLLISWFLVFRLFRY